MSPSGGSRVIPFGSARASAARLRDEAIKTIQSVISASKQVIVHQATKELREAQLDSARNSHALWRKQIQQDLETARKYMLAQGKEMSERLDAMALSTIERVQSEAETARNEAVDHFVSRIRDQVAPMLEVARDSLQRLEGAETALRRESESIFAGIENQLVSKSNESLAKALEDSSEYSSPDESVAILAPGKNSSQAHLYTASSMA